MKAIIRQGNIKPKKMESMVEIHPVIAPHIAETTDFKSIYSLKSKETLTLQRKSGMKFCKAVRRSRAFESPRHIPASGRNMKNEN